jgi:hypothetical protein
VIGCGICEKIAGVIDSSSNCSSSHLGLRGTNFMDSIWLISFGFVFGFKEEDESKGEGFSQTQHKNRVYNFIRVNFIFIPVILSKIRFYPYLLNDFHCCLFCLNVTLRKYFGIKLIKLYILFHISDCKIYLPILIDFFIRAILKIYSLYHY